MPSLAVATRLPIVRRMSDESIDAEEMRRLGRALHNLRKVRKLSLTAAGERYRTPAGDPISGEGFRKYEIGENNGIFRPDTQARLTAAIGATVAELLNERARLAGESLPAMIAPTEGERLVWAAQRAPEVSLLPIRERVQAGAWLQVDDSNQDQPPTHPVARDPRYPHAAQWLSEVVGDSVNRLNIIDGDLVHCVDAVDIGYYPRTGDIVVVERRRFGGHERELTIKQVEVGPEGIILWPRSTNARWSSPVEINAGLRDGEEAEVLVRALVIASIRRF